MVRCFELIVEGRVQGVGFRNFAYNRAVKHNITGYVKNTYEGNVKIVCMGQEADLDKFIDEMKKGPYLSYVSNIRIKESGTDENFNDFEIRFGYNDNE